MKYHINVLFKITRIYFSFKILKESFQRKYRENGIFIKWDTWILEG